MEHSLATSRHTLSLKNYPVPFREMITATLIGMGLSSFPQSSVADMYNVGPKQQVVLMTQLRSAQLLPWYVPDVVCTAKFKRTNGGIYLRVYIPL